MTTKNRFLQKKKCKTKSEKKQINQFEIPQTSKTIDHSKDEINDSESEKSFTMQNNND